MERMMDRLTAMKREHDFLVCVDSDGTVFDNMELKHKECFCPAFVNVWDLQAMSKYARQVWEYVNLYSKSRGANRFVALIAALDLLRARDEIRRRGFQVPDPQSLRQYISQGGATNNAGISAFCASHPADRDMERALRWSQEINENVARIVRGTMPFPAVRDTLQAFCAFADVVVVSDTPNTALTQEWKEPGIDQYATVICGQEFGGKKRCIETALHVGGYDKANVLMIGDAPRDQQAAQSTGVLFYPIVPQREDQAWDRLLREGMAFFHGGTYAGAYQEMLEADFDQALSDTPRWE